MGPHEGLLKYYEGKIDRAMETLTKTLQLYEQTRHTSGKVKTLLFLALCSAKQGDREAARDRLRIIKDLLATYE